MKLTIFGKTEGKATTGRKEKSTTKTTEIQKTSMATINEGDTVSTTGGNTTKGNKDN